MNKDDEKNKKAIADLEQLANEIGEAGAKDDLATGEIVTGMRAMAKGFQDAIGTLATMLKGAPPPPPDAKPGQPPVAPAAGADDDDDDDDATPAPAQPRSGKPKPKPPADPDSGYPDTMTMGEDGGDEFLDVEELIRDVQQGLVASRRNDRKMLKAVMEQNELLRAMLQLQVATTAPLAKGLQSLGAALVSVPAGSIIPAARAPADNPFVPRKVEHEGKLGALDDRTRGVVMLKALRARVISDLDLARWQETGMFTPDVNANKAVVAAVEALIA